MPTDEQPVYRFKMRRVAWNRDSYYHRSWENAVPVTVLASTQKEAVRKATAMSPELRSEYFYNFHVDGTEEVADAD